MPYLRSRSIACLITLTLLFTALTATAEPVRVWEGMVTLPTYPWLESPYPQFDALGGRIVYPYTMQDDILKKPVDRNYKAVFMENEYLRLTCLPELGGRIHQVFDKTQNTDMFHRNEEIKPALIAMRGAWIGGGIEWNTGPHGHTVTIVSPVDVTKLKHADGSATLVVGNTEQIFRTRWAVRVTLHPGKAYLDEEIRIFNPTDGVQPYYFWNCTGFPNRPGTRFIFPMSLGTDHAGENFFRWPINEGKDLTYLKNYQTMTSVFAYDCVFDFFGAYDIDTDRGVVAYANHRELKGKKAWTWGQDDFGITSQMALSDAGPKGAPYIEVQSGPLLTQAEYGMLQPRRQAAWREWWYPVHGLGKGFEYATKDVAIEAQRKNDQLELRLIATRQIPGARVTLSHEGKTLLNQSVDLSPANAQTVQLDHAGSNPIEVRISDRKNNTLAHYTTPLAIPEVEEPDLSEQTARTDGKVTVEEIYLAGRKLDSQTNPIAARTKYEEALTHDPHHTPSLKALAVLDIEAGLYTDAIKRLRVALDRDVDDAMAWWHLGVAHLNLKDFDEAARCGYKAAETRNAIALGYDLVGRALLTQGRTEEAVAAFELSLAHDPRDTRTRDHHLIALRAAGRDKRISKRAQRAITDDPTAMIPRAVAALKSESALAKFATDVADIVGERDFTMLEVSRAFSMHGLHESAERLLEAACVDGPDGASNNPLIYYELAWLASKTQASNTADDHLRKAATLDGTGIFPSRPGTIQVLEWAIDRHPGDARARLHMGNLLAGLRRVDEAHPWWRDAVRMDASLSVAHRNLGLYAWKKTGELEQARRHYERAIDAAPDHQDLYYDLARIMTELELRPKAIHTVEKLPRDTHWRADLLLWLARAYVDEARYDDAIDLLAEARFSNWEGATGPHDIFARAHIERGKLDFETEAYDAARAHFAAALTWPENLEVGRPYNAEEAEAHYWHGRALHAMDRMQEARQAWRAGGVRARPNESPEQAEYRRLCQAAIDLLEPR